jgi:hypothetical protein
MELALAVGPPLGWLGIDENAPARRAPGQNHACLHPFGATVDGTDHKLKHLPNP